MLVYFEAGQASMPRRDGSPLAWGHRRGGEPLGRDNRSRLRLGHLCQWNQENKGANGPIRGEERFLGILRALYGENVNRDWVSGIIIICVPSVDVRVDVDGDDFK